MHKTTVAGLAGNAAGIVEQVTQTGRLTLITDADGFPVAAVVPINAAEIARLAYARSPRCFDGLDPIDTAIVSVVARLPGRLSAVRPAHILYGSSGRATLADGHDLLPEYGRFATEEHAKLRQRTYDLIERGTLRRDEAGKLHPGDVDREALLAWLARPDPGGGA